MVMVLLINGDASNAWRVGAFLAGAGAVGLLCLVTIVRKYSKPGIQQAAHQSTVAV
jgi:hypothetical protein